MKKNLHPILNEDNIFLSDKLMTRVGDFHDKEVVEHIHEAVAKGWDMNMKYKFSSNRESSYYTALHACASYGQIEACELLIEMGMDVNFRASNKNTTFLAFLNAIHDEHVGVDKFLKFAKKLKDNGADLSLSGDEFSPLGFYIEANNLRHNLNPVVIDFLVENMKFENNFELNTVLLNNECLNFRVLKKIISLNKIDLKKTESIINEENIDTLSSNSHWNTIAYSMRGKKAKRKFIYVDWLHNKLGFELDNLYTQKDYDGVNTNNLKINLLGVAIYNKNKTMFKWIIKKRPHFENDKFIVENNHYSLLEYSLYSQFRHGVQYALRKMTQEEILNIDNEKMKSLCKFHEKPKTLETYEKTYIALIYKIMSSKYEEKNIKI